MVDGNLKFLGTRRVTMKNFKHKDKSVSWMILQGKNIHFIPKNPPKYKAQALIMNHKS